MFKPAAAIAVATAGVAATVALGGTATGATASNHPFTEHSRIAFIAAPITFPAPGTSSISAGINDYTPGGRTASVMATRITGITTHGEVTFTSKVREYNGRGIIISTAKGVATGRADGTTGYIGRGTYTGGTGRYRGLKGTYTFIGLSPKPKTNEQTVITLDVKGNMRY